MTDADRLTALVEEYRELDAETGWVEFKVSYSDPEMIGSLISAISNAARLADKACGYVMWGINNETHDIVGTDFRPGSAKAKGHPLEFWLAQMIAPSLPLTFKEAPHAAGRVVILEVPAAMQIPTKFNNIPYIRIGSATPKLADYPEHEAGLLSKLRPFAWEQGCAKSFVTIKEVFELLDVGSYFALTEQPVPGSDSAIAHVLMHDKLIQKDVGGRWNILNLGAILFANDITQFEGISRKSVRVISYEGQTRAGASSEQVGVKGYASGFEGLIAYVNKHLPHRDVITSSLRVRRPVYPEIAIRELVANALIHQDLTIAGAGPVIAIFSDRVEISNPGSPLVETNRFIDFPPRSRNETLASLMRRIGVCEEQGSGIDKVITAVEEAQLPAPDFRADGDNLKVALYGPRSFGDMTPEERVRGCYHHAVLRFIDNKGGMTNSTLRNRFGVAERNASQISRVIKQSVEAGLIRHSELFSSRSGHYLPFWA